MSRYDTDSSISDVTFYVARPLRLVLNFYFLLLLNGAFDKICAADGCSMKHSGNATQSGRAGHRRFHAKNFLVAAARTFAAGLALPYPARRVAAQPDCNRNLPPFSVRCRGR